MFAIGCLEMVGMVQGGGSWCSWERLIEEGVRQLRPCPPQQASSGKQPAEDLHREQSVVSATGGGRGDGADVEEKWFRWLERGLLSRMSALEMIRVVEAGAGGG